MLFFIKYQYLNFYHLRIFVYYDGNFPITFVTLTYFARNKTLIRRQSDSILAFSASCAAAFIIQFQKLT